MPEEKEVHMTVEQRKESWKREEEIARIHGWDFLIFMAGIRKKMIYRGILKRLFRNIGTTA